MEIIMSYTSEVPRREWKLSLDEFSREFAGRTVSVQTVGNKFGLQANAKNLALLGVTAEPKAGGTPEIEIIAGDADHGHVSHVIQHPTAVRVAHFDGGSTATLQIEAQEGYVTLLEVSPAAVLNADLSATTG
jgi:hypothetical protein